MRSPASPRPNSSSGNAASAAERASTGFRARSIGAAATAVTLSTSRTRSQGGLAPATQRTAIDPAIAPATWTGDAASGVTPSRTTPAAPFSTARVSAASPGQARPAPATAWFRRPDRITTEHASSARSRSAAMTCSAADSSGVSCTASTSASNRRINSWSARFTGTSAASPSLCRFSATRMRAAASGGRRDAARNRRSRAAGDGDTPQSSRQPILSAATIRRSAGLPARRAARAAPSV